MVTSAAAAPSPVASEAAPPRRPLPAPPIRVTARRFWLWSFALTLMSAIMVLGGPLHRFVDFPQFWYAGHLAGTPDLLDPVRQIAWEAARGFEPREFLYPPSTAWLYAPLSLVSLAAAFWIHAAVIWAIAIASGLVASRAFSLDRRVAVVATLAWAPVLAAAAVGHNAPLALLLALVAIASLRDDRDVLAGVAVGLMLYKPTLALPLLVLLLLRRRWLALASAVPVAGAWYLLAVAATAGDWLWPAHWLGAIGPFMQGNFEQNVALSIAVPELLIGHHIPPVLAYGVALAIGLAALPRLLRAPIVEAGAAACVVGVVVSQHSLQYEAVMVLPLLLWAAGGGLAEPWRTRLIVPAYLLAQLYLLASVVGLSVLAVIALAATVIWVTGWQRAAPPATAPPDRVPPVTAPPPVARRPA